ncbi:hypothetical protein NDU88_005068 [Pleurodeles waltl]|uniref:Receptor ligand binding region domain-containing protein n=1 Tax=Pleurodeles waltl TaxID=8319 RepID=A0AAV7V2X0_PLEWA|nr:hypothetical protein NDU88_005068 [Pleurodeles waltl]
MPQDRVDGVRKYLEASFGALDPLFSDKLKFPSFFRTVPNERSVFAGITQLLKHFGWTWVGILASDDDSGERAIRDLKMMISQSGGCVEFSYTLSIDLTERNTKRIDQIVADIQNCTAQVIIVYSTSAAMTRQFLYQSWKKVHHKVWIGSVNMSFSRAITDLDNLTVLNGTLTFSIKEGQILGFEDFLYDINPLKYPDDHAVWEFWVDMFNCSSVSKENMIQCYIPLLPLCSENYTLRGYDLSAINAFSFRFTYSVYTAVYALAHALHDMYVSESRSGSAAGSFKLNFKPWKVRDYCMHCSRQH